MQILEAEFAKIMQMYANGTDLCAQKKPPAEPMAG